MKIEKYCRVSRRCVQRILRYDYAYAKLTPFNHVSALHISKISSPQSNLAGSKQDKLATGITYSDKNLDEIKTPGVYTVLNTCPNFPDPDENSWGSLEVTDTGTGTFVHRLSAQTHEGQGPKLRERIYNSQYWSEWQRIATATPPQIFDLPLVEGFTPQISHTCIYCKTQENIVVLNVALVGEIQANSDVLIGTLPVGFRPKVTCRAAAASHFSPYGVGSVSIETGGNITARFTEAQIRCNFMVCYLAAD